jgi:hypothetical protein
MAVRLSGLRTRCTLLPRNISILMFPVKTIYIYTFFFQTLYISLQLFHPVSHMCFNLGRNCQWYVSGRHVKPGGDSRWQRNDTDVSRQTPLLSAAINSILYMRKGLRLLWYSDSRWQAEWHGEARIFYRRVLPAVAYSTTNCSDLDKLQNRFWFRLPIIKGSNWTGKKQE